MSRQDGSQREKDTHKKRTATIYDAVAGRIGTQSFLSQAQIGSDRIIPSKPEEVLLRRIGAPDKIPFGYYDADERLNLTHELPDSDLLKSLHAYVSDFYAAISVDGESVDFRSMDETALLALGILLEETSKEVLGENGDMVLVEPEGLEERVPLSTAQQHQIVGMVVPEKIKEYHSPTPIPDEEDEEERDEREPIKKRRRFKLRDADIEYDH